jgi:hypothetical protein
MRMGTISIMISVVVLAGCAQPQDDAGGAVSATQVDTSAIIAQAERTAAALRTGLVQRLTDVIQTQGAHTAIEVCATEALPLTDSIAREAGTGIALKRTARRLRNPANAPDSLETAALDWFDEQHSRGAQPPYLLQAVPAGGYRYYSPLRIAALCLNCHGAPESMSADVRAAIDSRYPDDQATGYAEGDFRGLLRVSVPADITPDDGGP